MNDKLPFLMMQYTELLITLYTCRSSESSESSITISYKDLVMTSYKDNENRLYKYVCVYG